jgi:hypothetical protein
VTTTGLKTKNGRHRRRRREGSESSSGSSSRTESSFGDDSSNRSSYSGSSYTNSGSYTTSMSERKENTLQRVKDQIHTHTTSIETYNTGADSKLTQSSIRSPSQLLTYPTSFSSSIDHSKQTEVYVLKNGYEYQGEFHPDSRYSHKFHGQGRLRKPKKG